MSPPTKILVGIRPRHPRRGWRLCFRGAYRLSGTGIVERLDIIDVGCNLKQFDILTWLTLTPIFATDLHCTVWSTTHYFGAQTPLQNSRLNRYFFSLQCSKWRWSHKATASCAYSKSIGKDDHMKRVFIFLSFISNIFIIMLLQSYWCYSLSYFI